MARLGVSPQREKLNPRPARRITLCMITHIPHLAGYYKDRMAITELSLNSMITNASEHREFDITILDQNSCSEWKSRLASWQESGWITNVIFLGHNVGKLEGLRTLFNAVSSEIVGYTDDDVLFFPEWLDKQVEVLQGFPCCGLVTGSPVLTKFKFYPVGQATMRSGDPAFSTRVGEIGKDYPMRWLEDDCLCRGMTVETYLQIVKDEEIKPLIVKWGDTEAWAVGHHMQLIAKRKTVMEYLPKPTRKFMGMMREWDVAMDNAGVIQLATLDRTCRHMGNVMDQSIVNDTIGMGLVL